MGCFVFFHSKHKFVWDKYLSNPLFVLCYCENTKDRGKKSSGRRISLCWKWKKTVLVREWQSDINWVRKWCKQKKERMKADNPGVKSFCRRTCVHTSLRRESASVCLNNKVVTELIWVAWTLCVCEEENDLNIAYVPTQFILTHSHSDSLSTWFIIASKMFSSDLQ